QEPACVKTCPTGAIHFGTKKEMLELGEQRVEKLKARGFEHAGLSHRAAHDTLPLRDAFAVLFFVSVGMLFDPLVLIQQPLAVLA
ncbi:hypothetical protein MJN51_36855, partial [Salmonella enterica subsp. enterica serovar Kentucky]|nr:hypothetical protein [Salmonella enterica subsp. enterica serovar Kentucky]